MNPPFLQGQEEATEIYIDNMSAISDAKNKVSHGRSKHIDTKYHFIRDLVKRNEVQLVYCKSPLPLGEEIEVLNLLRFNVTLRHLLMRYYYQFDFSS